MKFEKIETGYYYHIFNRGVNSKAIFKSDENKRYSLKLISKYPDSMVSVYAYCLMDNHFHLTLQINEKEKKL
ncbi:MAG: transposase [Flavobacteriaceae bacterium]|nr:transposase [Flavobacteriaceae bacterium]